MLEGCVVKILSPLTYKISFKIPAAISKNYQDVKIGDYKYFDEDSDEIKEDKYYVCRLNGLDIINDEYTNILNVVRLFFEKSNSIVYVDLGQVDLYKRILVDIYNDKGVKLYDHLEKHDKNLVKQYYDKNKYVKTPIIDDILIEI